MMIPSPKLSLTLAIAAVLASPLAWAETSVQATELDQIRVEGRRDSTPAAPTFAVERERLQQVPGGTNLIDLRDAGRQGTLRDALDFQPGLVVQDFFGGIDQPRLNVRGSGIQSNPLNRGITLLQDGVPLNEADGSFVIGLIEQRNSAFISAQRGANALTPAATTLGGEIDFHSLTGADERGRLRLEAGSYGKQGAQLAYGGSNDSGDWRVSASYDENDGYRAHSDGKRQSLQFNSGWRAGESFANRTYVSWTDLFFHIPGPLPKARAGSVPRSVMGDGNAPLDMMNNIHRRDPLRDTQQLRIANRSEWGTEQARQSVGVWWQNVEDLFKNPTTHNVRDTDTYGLQYQFSGKVDALDYRFGVAYTDSSGNRTLYANSPMTGTRLQRFGDYELDASSADLLASIGWTLDNNVRLIAETRWSQVKRDAAERISGARQNLSYSHASPRLGVTWQADEALRVFANLSRSHEVPTWWELVATNVPPPNPALAKTNLLNLRVQKADTVEIGASGLFGDAERSLGWQVTIYRSKVDDELLAIVDNLGNQIGTFNYADSTTHQGIEAGLNGQWPIGPAALDWKLAWTYSDFSFNGGNFSGNQIASVPKHLISSELLWNTGHFRLGPTVRWQPSDTPTDHINTPSAYQDGYALLGFKLDYRAPDQRWSVFLHADNLTDRNYASSTIVSGKSAQSSFLPGVGRNASLGVSWQF